MLKERHKKLLLLDISKFLYGEEPTEGILVESFYFLLRNKSYNNIHILIRYLNEKNFRIVVDREEENVVRFLKTVLDKIGVYSFAKTDYYVALPFYMLKLNEKCVVLIEGILSDSKYDITLFTLLEKYTMSKLYCIFEDDDIVGFCKLNRRFILENQLGIEKYIEEYDSINIFKYIHNNCIYSKYYYSINSVFNERADKLLVFCLKNGIFCLNDYVVYQITVPGNGKRGIKTLIHEILPVSGEFFNRLYAFLGVIDV